MTVDQSPSSGTTRTETSANFLGLILSTTVCVGRYLLSSQDDIVKDLEQPAVATKIQGIKQAILLLLSGENMPRYTQQQCWIVSSVGVSPCVPCQGMVCYPGALVESTLPSTHPFAANDLHP